MESKIHLHAIDTHTEGMPTRIITGGINEIEYNGGSVANQRNTFSKINDDLRKLLMHEPRGHEDMFGAVPTKPKIKDADLGLFFMDCGGYLDMCGHATIGVVTSFIETNRLKPKPELKIETPAGIVTAYPEINDEGKVENVGVQNVKSYIIDNLSIDISFGGTTYNINADIVSAGNVFALVDTEQVGLPIDISNSERFIELGLKVRSAINERCSIVDPVTEQKTHVQLTEFYESSNKIDRNIVIFAKGSIDRSPCGTGTCAKMTLLYDKDELGVGEQYLHESVIDTQFQGEIREIHTHNGIDVTTPVVQGSAYIVADHTFLLDSADPTPSFQVFEREESKSSTVESPSSFVSH